MSNINPYAKTNAPPDDDAAMQDAAMNDASQGGSASATGSSGAVDLPADQEKEQHQTLDDEVDFESDDFAVPPSFGRELSEEGLKSDAHPYVLWATLKILAPEKPGNAADAMFDCLADFVEAAAEEDKHFCVFAYHLSRYKSATDLPPAIVDLDSLPEEVDEWLQYFPGAKPRVKGGNVYTVILLGLSTPFVTFIKKLSPWCKEKKYGLWEASLQSEKPTSVGWLLFSTTTMDVLPLKEQISESIQDVPVGLRWKMINMGTQGQVKEADQVWALHLYVDELDVCMAKPLLSTLYLSHPGDDHTFPLHIRMRLVPEIDSVLNLKGRKNVDKLRACQNNWNCTKLTFIKTWEIKLLDSRSGLLGLSLRDVMMAIRHPTNAKFALFHSIDRSWRDASHILMVLKSAESYAHAMVLALLPYLQWKVCKAKSDQAGPIIAKWFKPEARARAVDAYWDPREECVKNASDRMIDLSSTDADDLYWVAETSTPAPKRKRVHADEESLDDSTSTVKTAVSTKSKLKSALKNSGSTETTATNTPKENDATTVASQNSAISQLTKQVSQIKMENKQVLNKFDRLADRMEQFFSSATSQPTRHHAGGHSSDSGHQK